MQQPLVRPDAVLLSPIVVCVVYHRTLQNHIRCKNKFKIGILFRLWSMSLIPIYTASNTQVYGSVVNTSTAPSIFSGNVGIGTTIPMNDLDVVGSASIGTYAGTAAPANSLIVSGNVGIGTTVMANTFAVTGTASIGAYANSAAPANGLIVSGSVGIGTIIPTDLLGLGPNGAAFPAPSGNAPLYACRAWVNFDGTSAAFLNTTTPYTGPIRGSGNVSGIIRTATGQYTINFAAAMSDANYSVTAISCNGNSGGYIAFLPNGAADLTTTSVNINTSRTGVGVNSLVVCVAVFR